jgi:hypothetical protein
MHNVLYKELKQREQCNELCFSEKITEKGKRENNKINR